MLKPMQSLIDLQFAHWLCLELIRMSSMHHPVRSLIGDGRVRSKPVLIATKSLGEFARQNDQSRCNTQSLRATFCEGAPFQPARIPKGVGCASASPRTFVLASCQAPLGAASERCGRFGPQVLR